MTTAKKQDVGVATDSALTSGSAASFFEGLTWMAAWLVDHCEGETVEELLVLKWADDALKEHKKRQNTTDEPLPKQQREND